MAIHHDDHSRKVLAAVPYLTPAMRPLLMVWLVLVSLHLVTIPFADAIWHRLFNLDDEKSFGTWFSVVILSCGGVLSLATATQVRDRAVAFGWGMVGVIMLAMSVEELVMMHEATSVRLAAALQATGYLRFAWVLVGGALAGVVLVMGWPLLARLPAEIRSQLLVAAALFLLGAIGVEMIGGNLYSIGMVGTPSYAIATAVEEALEILAVLVGIDALLRFRRQARLQLAV